MTSVKVAAVALNQTPLDWEQNQTNILTAIEISKSNFGANIICLPELCITGYGCEDAFFSSSVQQEALSVLDTVRKNTDNIAVSVGLPIVHRNALYNVAAFIANGQIRGFVPKQNLAADGVHYEPRWFKPGIPGYFDEIPSIGFSERWIYTEPFGDLIFNVNGIKVGFEICEDAWVADRPGSRLSKQGVDIILNPSASHFAFGKQKIRNQFVTEGSRAFRCGYVYANLLGNEAGRIIFDGDTIVASSGKIIAQGPRFLFDDVVVTTATIDIDQNRTLQLQTGSFRPESNVKEINCFYTPRFDARFDSDYSFVGHGLKDDNPYEEFRHAVALGLFDYMRKSNSKGFVVSLSGGADSSAVACLVREMRDIGIHELGREKFIKKLGHSDKMSDLLTCIYQRSENSSSETERAADELSESIGAKMIFTNIDMIVNDYVSIGEDFMGRKLTWEQDDIALQNIQARVRAPSAWLIANLKNALLLATSNRSEAAVGYCSMDGDTCGGLSPIAGIDKSFLRRWLLYMAKTDVVYNRALDFINMLQPTAELRPQNSKQTDEQDLMPYNILNYIEQMAIRDKMGPKEVFKKLCEQHSKKQSLEWTKKFFKLWSINQWKRERFAIAFHLDDHNLDPKTACRFPVLSGGYKKELQELNDT